MNSAPRFVQVGSVQLEHPILTASGTAGHGAELNEYMPLRDLGGVVVKSLAAFEWPGNLAPRLHPTPLGMLNSVGLQGRGVAHWIEHDLPQLVAVGATVVASIWGRSVEDYADAARMLAPVAKELLAVEINLSCPNVSAGAATHKMFAHDAQLTAEVIHASAVCGAPMWAKLSANTDRLVEVASSAQQAGADAVTLVNTMLGMVLDVETGLSVLGSGAGGGLSGRGIHPLAVRAVFEVAAALPQLAIVGVGGVASGHEAAEMILAGASAVQVGTATFAEPRAALRIQNELEGWAMRRGISDWSQARGAAHRGGLK